MGVEKLSISFDLDLGEAVRHSAEREGTTVSAWLARSARDRLRLEAMGDAILAWEKRFGALSVEELMAGDRELDQAAKRSRRKSVA